MTRRVILVGLLCLVVLAGCNGLGGTGGGEKSNANGTTGDAVASLAGVSASGQVNVTRLLAANWDALEATGFAAESWVNTTLVDSDTVSDGHTHAVLRVTAGEDRYRYRSNRSGGVTPDTLETVWSNGTIELRRSAETDFSGRSVLYERATPAEDFDASAAASARLLQFLQVTNYSVGPVTNRDGGTRVRLVAEGVDQSLPDSERVESLDGYVVVDAQNRIREVNVTATVQTDAGTVRVRGTYQLQQVGDVAVGRPDWVATGLREAPSVSVSATVVDGQYIQVRNTGPDPIASDWEFVVGQGTETGGRLVGVPGTVSPGESVYIYRPVASRTGMTASTERPTRAGEPLSGNYRIALQRATAEPRQTATVATARVTASGGSQSVSVTTESEGLGARVAIPVADPPPRLQEPELDESQTVGATRESAVEVYASSFVEVDLPDSVDRNATLWIDYNQWELRTNESAIAIYRHDSGDFPIYVRHDSTVFPSNDTVRASIATDGIYVAFDSGAWRDYQRNPREWAED